MNDSAYAIKSNFPHQISDTHGVLTAFLINITVYICAYVGNIVSHKFTCSKLHFEGDFVSQWGSIILLQFRGHI